MSTEAQQQPIIQRPLRGSRISTFYPVKSLPSLSSLDSAFQLQEYISLLIRLDVHDVEAITSLPGANKEGKDDKTGDKESRAGESGESRDAEGDFEKDGGNKEVTVDEACWIYEQLRRLAQDLTHPLITTLQQECSRSTCPEMKAGEWLYLCVAHGNDGATEQCCAIDYILHTLDSATALLNSPRAFPSRLQIPASSHRHFSSLARRLGRIFAHAYFHHREAFEQAEAESSLYARFLALTNKFDLVPSEFLVIPTAVDDEEEYDEHSRDSGFGLREAKSGTSYDPRRGLGQQQHPLHQQQQLLRSNEFPEIPRSRHPMEQRLQSYEFQARLQGHEISSGGDSPRKVGRSRTDTMVHSEIASVVDDLARNASKTSEEDLERSVREERERESREREKAETEQREIVEGEARRVAEGREKAEEEADEKSEKAEEEADEKREKAEEEADEKSEKAEEEADEKREKAEEEADERREKAEEGAEAQVTQAALDDLEDDDSKLSEPQPSATNDESPITEDEAQKSDEPHSGQPGLSIDDDTEIAQKEEEIDVHIVDTSTEILEVQEEPNDTADGHGEGGDDGVEQEEAKTEEDIEAENQAEEVEEVEEVTVEGEKDSEVESG